MLAAGWLAALMLGSVVPADTEQMPPAYVFGDFVLHALGYLGPTLLLISSQRYPRNSFRAMAAALIGLVPEGVQGLTGDRDPQVLGTLVNTLGALVGPASR